MHAVKRGPNTGKSGVCEQSAGFEQLHLWDRGTLFYGVHHMFPRFFTGFWGLTREYPSHSSLRCDYTDRLMIGQRTSGGLSFDSLPSYRLAIATASSSIISGTRATDGHHRGCRLRDSPWQNARFINAFSSYEVIGRTGGPREEGKRQGEICSYFEATQFRRIEVSAPVSKMEQARQTISRPGLHSSTRQHNGYRCFHELESEV